MSDDIDIEEHDVLQDPYIRRIFPDLTIIKKEISQFEDGLDTPEGTCVETVDSSKVQVQPTVHPYINSMSSELLIKTEDINELPPVIKGSDVHQTFKKFLDSLADDTSVKSDASSNSQLDLRTQSSANYQNSTKIGKFSNNNIKNVRNNVFILGSKPTVTSLKKSSKQNRELKVMLKDVSSYLNSCKWYCKLCLILFPNIEAFHQHDAEMHLCKTDNSSTTKMGQSLNKHSIRFQCEICTITLSSKGNLVRHYKMVHKSDAIAGRLMKLRNDTQTTNNVINEPLQKSASIKFDTEDNKSTVTSNQDTNINETNQSSSVNKKSKVNNTKHKCFHCNKVFDSQSSLIEHLYEVIEPNKTVSNKDKKPTPVSESNGNDKRLNDDIVTNVRNKCITCNINFSTKSLLNSHNRNTHLKNKAIPNKIYDKTENNLNKQTNILNSTPLISIDTCAFKENNECVGDNNYKVSEFDSQISSDYDSGGSDWEEINIKYFPNHSNAKTQYYQCYICCQYFMYFKNYIKHMNHHNIKEIADVDKVTFDSKCPFCNVKLLARKFFNKHLVLSHPEKLKVKIEMDKEAFHSVLFKCVKCDVFFLSANAAMRHNEHKDLFVNWRCLDCQRIFKIKDKKLHEKQHAVSKHIVAYDSRACALDRILYKCLKCAVHFSEKKYFVHYPTCGTEIPMSIYCKTCDILINSDDMVLHEDDHQKTSQQPNAFTFIESDIIKMNEKQFNDGKMNDYDTSKLALTFCNTCNTYLRNRGKQDNIHLKGRCSGISSVICKICGLAFTKGVYRSHKRLHEKMQNLNLQSFYFYDFKSNKQIQPLVPNCPKCNKCEIHFLNKQANRRHECNRQNYITCKICKIKLTEAAFKVHKQFHTYNLSGVALRRKLKTKLRSKEKFSDVLSSEKDMPISSTNNTGETRFMYSCVSCHIKLDTYDKMVEHCHKHYDLKEIISLHLNNIHSSVKYNDQSVTTIEFDPFYFRFDGKVWHKHVFRSVTHEHFQNILEQSIYKFECRVKLQEIQSGPSNLILYKCDRCSSFINPANLYIHAKNTCDMSKRRACSYCGLYFYTQGYQMTHEKSHEDLDLNATSYKIFLFNNIEHQQFTNMIIESRSKFVFYQCRTCEVVVDRVQREIHQCNSMELKKCPRCGLLFYDQEFNSHIKKHEEILNFKPEQMVIIKFGKLESVSDDSGKSSFTGTVCDLMYYKCTNCGLCLKSESEQFNHTCVSKSARFSCPKCYLCFSKQGLQNHVKLHDHLELHFDDFHSSIITFDKTASARVSLVTAEDDKPDFLNQNNVTQDYTESEKTKATDTTQKLYKCSCGLHFLDEFNASKHCNKCNPNMKISKQRCLKCDLLFSPGELFNHLLKHHGNKNIEYKYDILSITKST